MQLVEQVQLEIGDVDKTLFTPEQIEHKLNDRGGNVLATAADLCDILATRYAGQFDFASAARMNFKRSQKSEAYERRAKAIRERIGGLNVVPLTRTDGFTDDISVRDGAGQGNSRTGRIRRGYTDPDQPV